MPVEDLWDPGLVTYGEEGQAMDTSRPQPIDSDGVVYASFQGNQEPQMQLVNEALAHSSHSFPDSDSCLCVGLAHGLLPACCPVWTMKGDNFRKEQSASEISHGIPCGAFNPI